MTHWHYTHKAHHTAHSPKPYLVSFFQNEVCHPYNSLCWMLNMFSINLSHHLQVIFALALWSVVDTYPAKTQNRTLLTKT